jgi:tyrosine-protein kinase Etk/Wzc
MANFARDEDEARFSSVRELGLGPAPLPHRERRAAVSPGAASDLLDLAQLWSTVRSNLSVVLGVAALVFLGVMLVTLASKTQFQATGRLYLGELDAKARGNSSPNSNEFDISGGGQGELGSEIEIIKSRGLVSQAILASGLNVTITPEGEGQPRYWRWLLSRRDPALLDVALGDLRAMDATLAERFREPQLYRLLVLTDDRYEISTEQGRLGQGRLGEPLKTGDFTLTLVAGSRGKPKPGATYELAIRPFDRTMDDVLELLQVSAPKSSLGAASVNVLTLEFTDSSPQLAASFLEHLMRTYLRERQTWKTEDASAAEAFVTNQLQSIRESLDGVQQKLASYRSANRVVVLDNEAKTMIEQIAKYEEQRVAARLQVAALNDIKRALKNANAPMGAYLLGDANDKVLESMATSLSEARQKLTDLKARYNPVAPELREQQDQVEAQLDLVKNYVSSRLGRAQESLGALGSIIAQFEAKLKTVPGAELALTQLSRESEVYSKTYSYLLERQQQAAIVKASTLSKNRILDSPQAPHREHSPKLLLRLASGFIGLFVGAMVVLLGSAFASTLQNERDVYRSIGSTPVLAKVPRRRRGRGEHDPDEVSTFDVPPTDPDFEFVEAFRALRANLYYAATSSGLSARVLLVTSPSRGDGKTTCVRWLASALAADSRRVLVIDADMRKAAAPSEPSDEDEPYAHGLYGVLTGRFPWREAVQRISLSFGEVHAIESGASAPPELLSGQAMALFLKEARNDYEFIVIDSPSFPFVSDALVLAASADAVVSVIRYENTSRALATEHLYALSRAASHHAVVINEAGKTAARKSGHPGLHLAGIDSFPAGVPRRPARVSRFYRWFAAALVLALVGTASLAIRKQLSNLPPSSGERH